MNVFSEPQPAAGPSSQAKTPSRKTSTNAHRLLYRGSLSLPDSHISLDGLSFTTNIAESRLGNSPSTTLLDNPLALALESMRGRPLHFKGTERLQGVWLDSAIDIHVYVHPEAVVTQMYFENTFCLAAITSANRRTDEGIRVGLSDSSNVDDFMVYGELRPNPEDGALSSSSSKPPETLHILAARILPHPPTRLPRPDDPTPRKPPAHLLGGPTAKRKRDASSTALDSGEGLKRTKSAANNNKGKGRAGEDEDEQVRLAREVMLNMPKPGVSLPRVLGRDARPGQSSGVFKVPPLPVRAQSHPNAKGTGFDDLSEIDVFGSVDGKTRTNEKPGSDELEKANKTVIKQATMTCLSKHGIRKGHPEFSELFSMTYRGTAFALRNIIRVQAVLPRNVDKLLETHARIYINGTGESHAGGGDKNIHN